MTKRGLVGALAALTLVTVGLVAGAAAASAEVTNDCKTGSVQITDRPDSGVAGTWALDTFTRTYEVCRVVEPVPTATEVAAQKVEVDSWTYLVKGTDAGTFKAQGTKTPAGNVANPLWFPNRVGEFNGKWSLTVEAPAEWQFFKGGYTGNDKATSDWIAALWSDGYKPGEFTDWAWTYKLCGEKWVNSAKGNSGDITGKFDCAKPEVTFTQAVCDTATYKLLPAKLTVKNTKNHTPITVRFSGEVSVPQKLLPGEVVTREFTEGKVTLWLNGKFVGKYTYVAPPCVSPTPTTPVTESPSPNPEPTETATPTPTASASETTEPGETPVPAGNVGGDGGNLAKTGSPILMIGGAGALLFVAGAGILLLTIRRRREEQNLDQTAQFPAVQ